MDLSKPSVGTNTFRLRWPIPEHHLFGCGGRPLEVAQDFYHAQYDYHCYHNGFEETLQLMACPCKWSLTMDHNSSQTSLQLS